MRQEILSNSEDNINNYRHIASAVVVFFRRRFRSLLHYGIFATLLLGAAGWAQAQSADLLVSQIYTPNPMPAGATATYTITVANAGPNSANAVQLTDTLPAGAIFVSVTPAVGSCTTSGTPTNTVSCDLGNLSFPGSTTVELKVTLPDKGVWPNHVAVTSSTPDLNLQNNQSDLSITVLGNADLSLAGSSDKGTSPSQLVKTGEPYNYALVATNHGPDALPAYSATTVSFEVPAGAMITALPSGTGWVCTPASGYPIATPSTLIQCVNNDSLAVGASFPTLTVPAVANATQAGNITANFSLESAFPDGDVSNNLPVVTVHVGPELANDMGITKVGPVGTLAVGEHVTYTLTVTFHGGVEPTNVTVTDELPPGLSYDGYDAPTPWICKFTDPEFSCVYPGAWEGGYTNLPAITLKAVITDAGHIQNTARVESDQIDPDPDNNTSTTSLTGTNVAQLWVTKTPNHSPVMVGEDYLYSVVVRNSGPVKIKAGQKIILTETLPAGMQLTAPISGTDWSCDSNTLSLPFDGPVTITCTYTAATDLEVWHTFPFLGIWVKNTVGSPVANHACVNLDPGTVPLTDNPATSDEMCSNFTVPTTPTGEGADLSITKTADKTELVVGEKLTYTLTIHNNGPFPATNVHVKDKLDNLLISSGSPTAGLESTTVSQGSCLPVAPIDGSVTIDCNLGTLDSGDNATVTIVIYPGDITADDFVYQNTATVNSEDVGDPDRSNNTSNTVDTTVHPRVDVVVDKSVSPSIEARVGEPLVYVVTARNDGPSTAKNVKITDAIPLNTAFIDVVEVTGGATCTWPAAGATSGPMTCTWPSISPHTQYTATYRLRPLKAALGTTITNTVHISTDSVELDTTNNDDPASVHIIEPQLDVLVSKKSSADPVLLGDEVTYTITIKNVGMSFGTNLVMTDTFPAPDSSARFSYEGGLSAPGAICTEPPIGALAGTLTCTFPVIAPGDANVITVTYKMHARGIVSHIAWSGTFDNHVQVSVDEPEDTLDNNQVDEKTTARLLSVATDLGLVKTVDKKTVRSGEQATYTLVVTNHGPLAVEESNDAIVTDPLPAGVSFLSSPDGCFLAAPTSNIVTCLVGHLAAGDNKTFRIVVSINPSAKAGALLNEATVTVEGDTDPDNDKGQATTTVGGDGTTATAIPSLNSYGLLILLAAVALLGAYRRKYWA